MSVPRSAGGGTGGRTGLVGRWKDGVRALKRETYALSLAYRRPDVPWYAKAFALCVVAYALSPIDLIPDFIPVLGYLDDLVLVPLGIVAARRMIPPRVMEECRREAERAMEEWKKDGGPRMWGAAVVIVAVWAAAVALAALAVVRAMKGRANRP